MGRSQRDLRQTLGSAARLWASPRTTRSARVGGGLQRRAQRQLQRGLQSVGRPAVLTDRCLQPILDLGRPAIIMLAGPGLGTAQKLVEIGWVDVGALPLMELNSPTGPGADKSGVRALSLEDLPAARELLSDTYGLDRGSAVAAVPDRVLTRATWGPGACSTGTSSNRVSPVRWQTGSSWCGPWPPGPTARAGLRPSPPRGGPGPTGRSGGGQWLTAAVLGSGQRLYSALGYSELEHWQLWSRPRWVMANA